MSEAMKRAFWATAGLPVPEPTPPLLPTDSFERKMLPMARGVLDYFPAALAEVAYASWVGNEKHNPAQVLHWSRGNNSDDHADCLLRHLAERGSFDAVALPDGTVARVRHSAYVAWRALALLQLELEEAGEAAVAVTPIEDRCPPQPSWEF